MIRFALLAVLAVPTAQAATQAGTYSCQKDGAVMVQYQPFGRVPRALERMKCTRKGGQLMKTKTVPKKIESPK